MASSEHQWIWRGPQGVLFKASCRYGGGPVYIYVLINFLVCVASTENQWIWGPQAVLLQSCWKVLEQPAASIVTYQPTLSPCFWTYFYIWSRDPRWRSPPPLPPNGLGGVAAQGSAAGGSVLVVILVVIEVVVVLVLVVVVVVVVVLLLLLLLPPSPYY